LRHQTLRATLDWSFDLLPEPEQCLLRRLGVFAAGFTFEAANAVMSAKGHAAPFLLEQIAGLVAKSLVTLDRSAPTGRWRLLDTTRDYALEKLAESGEFAQVARRCVEYFRDLVRPAMHGSQVQPSVHDMARYAQEIDNVRACIDWSFSPAGDMAQGVVLTAAYAPVWLSLSLVVECRERAERALECLETDPNLNAFLRVQLYVALGTALVYTMGSNERIRLLLAKALDAAESLDDVGATLEILFLSWGVYYHSGDCRDAQVIAERFERLALRTGDPTLAPVAHRLVGNCLHNGGKQLEAQHAFERMFDAYTAPAYQRHTIWTHYDLRVLGQAALARVFWLRGLVDQGILLAQASFKGAQAANHKPTLCWVLHYGAYPFALMTGDLVAAERAVTMLMDLATSLSAPFWKTLAHCLEGKLLIRRGEFAKGSVLLRSALDTCEKTGWTLCYPEFLGALAEGLAGQGQFTEALATVDRALARAECGGERLFVAEILRAKGEILLRAADSSSIPAAERCFNEALEVARAQDALSLELRTALTLARLRIKQDRQDDARQLVMRVYDRFTEGFETPDLRSASALLRSLSSRPAGSAT
jgi:predicted ATPase